MLTQNKNKAFQIKEAIRERINTCYYKEKQRLPSTRMLADEFGVSPVTASLAIAGLKSEGLLSTRQGSGTFVIHSKNHPQQKDFRSYRIGLVYPIANNSYAGNPKSIHPVITDYVEGLENAFAKTEAFSINLLPQELNVRFNNSRIAEMVANHQLDAIALAGEQSKEDIEWLLANNIPSVMLNFYSPNIHLPYIKINDFAGYRLLCNHLGQRGHKKLLYLTYRADPELIEHGPYNYIHASQNAGIKDFSEDSILSLDNTHPVQQSDYVDLVEKALSLKPDSIICSDEVITRHLIWACLKRNISIPNQISITSKSDILSDLLPIKITTLNTTEMLKECARISADLLSRKISGENISGKSLEMIPVLIQGDSVLDRT